MPWVVSRAEILRYRSSWRVVGFTYWTILLKKVKALFSLLFLRPEHAQVSFDLVSKIWILQQKIFIFLEYNKYYGWNLWWKEKIIANGNEKMNHHSPSRSIPQWRKRQRPDTFHMGRIELSTLPTCDPLNIDYTIWIFKIVTTCLTFILPLWYRSRRNTSPLSSDTCDPR